MAPSRAALRLLRRPQSSFCDRSIESLPHCRALTDLNGRTIARRRRRCFSSSASHSNSSTSSSHSSPPAMASSALSSPSPTSSTSSSVNASEISHFDTLAASWWDPHGSSRLLHLMNPLRHDFIADCLRIPQATSSSYNSSKSGNGKTEKRKLRYLDVGCGGGIFAESAARLPTTASVTAIDPSAAVLAVARRHAAQDPILHNPSNPNPNSVTPQSKLLYLNTSIEALPLPTSPAEQFDILALWEVIEHVDAPAHFLERCLPFVRPGGWLVLSTIARTWTSWLTTKVVAEEVLRIVPRGTHDWSKYVEADELERWFVGREGWATGAAAMRCQGVVYVPGLGWRPVEGGERWGNYFFGVRKDGGVEED